MGSALEILAALVIKYGPQIETDIVEAFHKAGYTVSQIAAVFDQVKPYEELGINPDAPVKPEPTENPAPPAQPPTTP